MALPAEVTAVVRGLHIVGAIVWLGFLYFMVFVRPRVLGGLPEETRRQIMPHLSKFMAPWLGVSATATILFGAVLYWDFGDTFGFDQIGWGLNLAVGLAFLMYVLGLAFILPVAKRSAKVLEGGKPPKLREIERAGTVGLLNAILSFVVVFLMVASQRIAAFS